MTMAIPSGLYPWLRQTYSKFFVFDSWHHAVLFTSTSGLGKEQLVARLVELRHCSAPSESAASLKACGHCQNCLLHASGTHPEYIVIAPLEGKAQISIEQIRACGAKVINKGLISRFRIVQISQAHLMTVSAANALLKMLEEPPSDVYFLLVSDQPAQLAATVLSRCVQQAIALPKPQQTLGWVNRQLDNPITMAQLHLVDCSPLRALGLANVGGFEPLQQLLDGYLLVLSRLGTPAGVLACLNFIDILRGRGKALNVLDALNMMQLLHRAVLKLQLAPDATSVELLANADRQQLRAVNPQSILRADSGIIELKQQLILNNGINVLLQLQQVIVNCSKNA